MRKLSILFGSVLLSTILAIALISALPGHYHLDETKIQSPSGGVDWTRSWDYPDQSLFSLLSERISYTIGLQLTSFLIMTLGSFLFCLIMLKWSHTEVLFQKILTLGISAPALFWIPLLIYFFSIKLNLFPLRFESTFQGWILPVLALTFRPLCLATQILLSEWKKAESQNYFLVARSKGLSKTQAYLRHGLKNALIPYSTQLGHFLAQTLMGSVLVENIFSFPGMGLMFVEALQNRDLPVVLALTLLFTFIIFAIHILIEFIHSWLEPRRQEKFI